LKSAVPLRNIASLAGVVWAKLRRPALRTIIEAVDGHAVTRAIDAIAVGVGPVVVVVQPIGRHRLARSLRSKASCRRSC
jgi:hypothetical protein